METRPRQKWGRRLAAALMALTLGLAPLAAQDAALEIEWEMSAAEYEALGLEGTDGLTVDADKTRGPILVIVGLIAVVKLADSLFALLRKQTTCSVIVDSRGDGPVTVTPDCRLGRGKLLVVGERSSQTHDVADVADAGEIAKILGAIK